MRAVYETLLDAGFEGMVVKTPDHEYQLKRSWDWMKLKNTKAEDCPIVGYYEGKGKYAGKLGGVTVERRNGYISRVGGGFSDAERTNIYKNFSEYEYRFIEVHYHEDTPDGDFRHARKDRWRIDLDSENSR
jgi:DNA ligase-1